MSGSGERSADGGTGPPGVETNGRPDAVRPEPPDGDGVCSGGSDPNGPDTDALLADLRRGDPAAFEALATEYGPRLFRLALHLTGRREESEDLVQEALVRALPALRSFEGRARLSTYLCRALTNLWKNRLRSRARSRIVDWLGLGERHRREDGDPRLDPPDPAPSPEALLAQDDDAAAVRRAVLLLDPDRRLALLLREVEELSYEEIAAVTGVPVGTVRSRLARARDDLRRSLQGRP